MDRVEHFPQVCIIESPNPRDVLDGRKEGDALAHALRLGGVTNHYYFVTTNATLDTCFERMASDVAIVEKNGVPCFPMLYIHFSAHGDGKGVFLTNDDFVSWSQLGDKLIRFAESTGRIFPELPTCCLQTICFSVCYGLHGLRMADRKRVWPYYGIVASKRAVSWADSLTAFVTFYHNACHKRYDGSVNPPRIMDAVHRMNVAIGETDVFEGGACNESQFPGTELEFPGVAP